LLAEIPEDESCVEIGFTFRPGTSLDSCASRKDVLCELDAYAASSDWQP
jgi:hypothetical protein